MRNNSMLLFKLDMFCKHTECYLIMLEFYYIHDRCLLGE